MAVNPKNKPADQDNASKAETVAETPQPVAAETPQPVAAETLPAKISDRAVATIKTPAGTFKLKQQITRPLLKHHDDETVAVKFLCNPYIGKEVVSANKMEPALLVNVIDLSETGGVGEKTYILNSVLYNFIGEDKKTFRTEKNDDLQAALASGKASPRGELHDAFPEGLAGHAVLIQKFPKEANKRYNTFSVVEIEAE